MPTKKTASATTTTVQQGAKFGVVGVSNTLIDFTLFTAIKIIFHVPLASVFLIKYFSGSVAMINSFYWNRRWVFHSKSRLNQTVVKFLVATLASVYIIQPSIVRLFTATGFGQGFGLFWYHLASTLGIIGLAPQKLTSDFVVATVAFGMGVVASAIWNFTLYKLWAFRSK